MKLSMLLERDNNLPIEVSPDDFVRSGNDYVTFIYDHNKVLIFSKNGNHFRIIKDNLDYYRGLFDRNMIDHVVRGFSAHFRGDATADKLDNEAIRFLFSPDDVRDIKTPGARAILGRVGTIVDGTNVLTAWNYSDLLRDCLEKLLEKNIVTSDTSVAFTYPPKTVEDIIGSTNHTNQSNAELARRLHLLTGAEKRAAMKQLGVGVGGKPHKMQLGLDRASLRTPGQKWWAMNSESAKPSVCRLL